MNVAILGASGQVGRALSRTAETRGLNWSGTFARHPVEGLSRLDIRDAAAVQQTIVDGRADIVFLPGAMTYVDGAESNPAEAHAINVDGTANVAAACRRMGALLVYFSTEHVFPESEAAHAEEDATGPLSVYAKTKLLGEQRIGDILPNRHLILRTSWVFGPDEQQKNFVYRAVRTLREGKTLEVPNDQTGQPTFSIDLAEAALDIALGEKRGTFHVTGPDLFTRFDFAQLIGRVFGLSGATIQGFATEELRQAAPRPRRVELLRQKVIDTMKRDPIRSPALALTQMRDGVYGHVP